MKRRTVLAGSLAVGLAPLTASAQDVPNRATRRDRIEVARRWEEEVVGGANADLIRELTSPAYESPNRGNSPGVDALVERFVQIFRIRAGQFDRYRVTADAFAVSEDSVSVRTTIRVAKGGRSGSTTGMSWYVFDDQNLVTTAWSVVDENRLLDAILG